MQGGFKPALVGEVFVVPLQGGDAFSPRQLVDGGVGQAIEQAQVAGFAVVLGEEGGGVAGSTAFFFVMARRASSTSREVRGS